jgi:hypothetical protein
MPADSGEVETSFDERVRPALTGPLRSGLSSSSSAILTTGRERGKNYRESLALARAAIGSRSGNRERSQRRLRRASTRRRGAV